MSDSFMRERLYISAVRNPAPWSVVTGVATAAAGVALFVFVPSPAPIWLGLVIGPPVGALLGMLHAIYLRSAGLQLPPEVGPDRLRAARRAVRAGVPSGDPAVDRYALSMAEAMSRQPDTLRILLLASLTAGVCGLFMGGLALAQADFITAVCGGIAALAAFFNAAVTAPLSYRWRRGAARLVAAVDRDSGHPHSRDP